MPSFYYDQKYSIRYYYSNGVSVDSDRLFFVDKVRSVAFVKTHHCIVLQVETVEIPGISQAFVWRKEVVAPTVVPYI